MTVEKIVAAYGERACEYVAFGGDIDQVAAPDLVLIENWAGATTGRIVDVGCGPGQWTHHLAQMGFDVVGIDPVPEFIDSARGRFPGVQYAVGNAESLEFDIQSLGGVLAWYSLIHTHPNHLGIALAEFGRCIQQGGSLALGFFAGHQLEPFPHAIIEAYYWPFEFIQAHVEAAGFAVTHTETRTDPGKRTHGALIATRN